MGLFDLFKPASSGNTTSDDKATSAIVNADTVRTTDTITKFIPATAGQVSAAQAQLRRRQEQQKYFFQLLDIKAQHSKLDTEANTKLFEYLAKEHQEVTQRKLARYPLKMAVEQSRLAYAKADHQLGQTRAKVDAEIRQLEAARAELGKQIKGAKR